MAEVPTANQMESTDADHGILDVELSQESLDGEMEVTELWSVQTAEEALARFGFAPGDHIPRREQIKIYERAHKAISAKKKELVDEGRYVEVFWLEDKLSDIKRQFQEMQLMDTEKEQTRQHALYKAAEKTCIAKDECALHEAARRVEQVCAMREADLERLHLAQREKLELEISWLPRPRIKYTNRFLHLQKTKAGLLRLHQYKDAHTVHNMLSKLQPVEEEAFLASYNEQISLKRRQLEERQAQDRAKLQKLLTTYRLREKRKREIGANNLRNKLAHSEQSMSHAHHMALKRRPELSQNPSAHWQRRAHFATTAAALRGEQLAQAVKGKTTASTIKVADLTSIHNFRSIMSGSVTTFEVPASLVSAKPVV